MNKDSKNLLVELLALRKNLISSNSVKHKQQCLMNVGSTSPLGKLLGLMYNPFVLFGVTDTAIQRADGVTPDSTYIDEDLFTLLDRLHIHKRKLAGHAAVAAIQGFLIDAEDVRPALYYVLNKDLKANISHKTLNNVWPGFCPDFKVALCDVFGEKMPDLENEEWYASRKMDGVRLITRIDEEGNCLFLSRSGKPFLTLDVLEQHLKGLGLADVVLDGELCIIENGLENFQKVVGDIRRKDYTIQNPAYRVFDVLTHAEFDSHTSDVLWSDRLSRIGDRIPTQISGVHMCALLKQVRVKSLQQVEKYRQCANQIGWEGLILRKNAPYKGKRSADILKVKDFYDAEYEVKDIVSGMWDYQQGQQQLSEIMLCSVEIEHKGHKVNVGSGFTIAQRKYYHNNPEELIGSQITVQYFGESVSKSGGISLRFPTLKTIHKGERNI